MNYIFPFLISFTLSVLFTLVVKKMAFNLAIVDKPGKRKIHSKSTPLLGGTAIFAAFFLSLFIFSAGFLLGDLAWNHLISFFFGGLIITLGGALDDKYNLKPRVQILFPLLAISILILGGIGVERLSSPFGGVISLVGLSWLSTAIVAIWTLGMMYTTKLLDGVDGLVSGMGAIGALIIFLFTTTTTYFQPDIALAAIILAAAILGFLVFNFHPAKIFLGEGGSLFIGYALGVLSIISGSKIAIALLIMGIPILDVFWTIIRRVLQGKNPFRFADNRHLHHRLLGLGLSQRQTVFIFYSLAATFGISGLFLQSKGKFLALLLLVALMILVVSFFHILDYRQEGRKPRLLLHVCCLSCAVYISKAKSMNEYRVTWLFYDANISDRDEHSKRVGCLKTVAKKIKIPYIITPFKDYVLPDSGQSQLLSEERYRQSLALTVNLAKEQGFNYFSTSLLHQSSSEKSKISELATDLTKGSSIKFLDIEFTEADPINKFKSIVEDLDLEGLEPCQCRYCLSENNEKK